MPPIDPAHLTRYWLPALVIGTFLLTTTTSFMKMRKIQPRGFKLKILRNEFGFAILNMLITGFTLGPVQGWLRTHGFIAFNMAPAAWWQVLLEYVLYFFLFDTWFYWLHRWMHKEPIYTWIHKIHHRSTAPNPLTTFSVSPLESFINGGFVPLFLTLFTVHTQTAALILPTNVIMGIYVHLGYEFLPRWWHKSRATKWFITTTFHDQHHKYFNYNFGGYTQIWDRICGTTRKKYESDFENPAGRRQKARMEVEPEAVPAE